MCVTHPVTEELTLSEIVDSPLTQLEATHERMSTSTGCVSTLADLQRNSQALGEAVGGDGRPRDLRRGASGRSISSRASRRYCAMEDGEGEDDLEDASTRR